MGMPASTAPGTPAQVRRFAQALLPNSRLIVTPVPFYNSDAWQLQLFLAPRMQARAGPQMHASSSR